MSAQNQASKAASTYPFELPPLDYDYNALDQYIDEQTMRLHHDKHHQTYVDNLNAALKDHAQFQSLSIEELLQRLDEVPEAVRTAVRNNGGGHANHTFFWKLMAPGMADAKPTGALLNQIDRDFGSFDDMKAKFEDEGKKRFGSGWVFLTKSKTGDKLEILSLPNQDTVLSEGRTPIVANDVWEHAYYLKYQNRRPDYLKAWWNTVNWSYANERFESAMG